MRSCCLALFWFVLAFIAPGNARAVEPSDAEIAQMQALFGYDKGLDAFVRRSAREFGAAMVGTLIEDLPSAEGVPLDQIVPAEAIAAFDQCLYDQMHAGFAPAIADALRTQFESRENVTAWRQFAQTQAGSKVMQSIRARVTAAGGWQDQGTAAIEQVLSTLSPQQVEQVRAFLRSPAGTVIRKKLSMPKLDTEALSERIFAVCVIDPDSEQALDALLSKDPDGAPDSIEVEP